MGAYSSTPTVDYIYEVADRNGKTQGVRKGLTLTISSQGGATNTIGYAALGFRSGSIFAVTVRNYTDGSSQNRGIVVWTDGSNILLGDPQTATDADRCEPVDLSGTLALDIFGWPA